MASLDAGYVKQIALNYKEPVLESRRKFILKIIRDHLSKSASILLAETGQNSPPFYPEKIKSIALAKIHIEVDKEGKKIKEWEEGKLIPSEEGFVILLNGKRFSKKNFSTKIRMRATIAHEIAHTFFYDVDHLPPTRLKLDNIIKNAWEEEDLCRSFVRELLVPRKHLEELFKKNDKLSYPSLKNLAELRKKFLASYDILAYRVILDVKLWNAAYYNYRALRYESGEAVFKRYFVCKPGKVFKDLKFKPRLDKYDKENIIFNILTETLKEGKIDKTVKMKDKVLKVESRIQKDHIVGLVSLPPDVYFKSKKLFEF
ncbi:MAG: ImmA/IrrE family metallo-endopeptidase [Thermoproteota archaeon]